MDEDAVHTPRSHAHGPQRQRQADGKHPRPQNFAELAPEFLTQRHGGVKDKHEQTDEHDVDAEVRYVEQVQRGGLDRGCGSVLPGQHLHHNCHYEDGKDCTEHNPGVPGVLATIWEVRGNLDGSNTTRAVRTFVHAPVSADTCVTVDLGDINGPGSKTSVPLKVEEAGHPVELSSIKLLHYRFCFRLVSIKPAIGL